MFYGTLLGVIWYWTIQVFIFIFYISIGNFYFHFNCVLKINSMVLKILIKTKLKICITKFCLRLSVIKFAAFLSLGN